jgi:hypothetical protein
VSQYCGYVFFMNEKVRLERARCEDEREALMYNDNSEAEKKILDASVLYT